MECGLRNANDEWRRTNDESEGFDLLLDFCHLRFEALLGIGRWNLAFSGARRTPFFDPAWDGTSLAVYPLRDLSRGYAVVMLLNPIRLSLRDGSRCITRFKRISLTFILLGFAYSVFQFATFTPLQRSSDLDFSQVLAPETGPGRALSKSGAKSPCRRWKGSWGFLITRRRPIRCRSCGRSLDLQLAGITRGVVSRAAKAFSTLGSSIYFVLLISVLATLLKPIAFWFFRNGASPCPPPARCKSRRRSMRSRSSSNISSAFTFRFT